MYISKAVDLGRFGWQDLDINYTAIQQGRFHDITIVTATWGNECVLDVMDKDLADEIRSDIQSRLLEVAA